MILSLNFQLLCFKIVLILIILTLDLSLTHVFSGYIGSVSFLNTVLDVVSKLRSINPKLTYGEISD